MPTPSVGPSDGARPPEFAAATDRARFLSHAAAISAQLRENALETPGERITWHAPPGSAGDGPPVSLGPHVYGGVLGVALFLAAHDYIRGRNDDRELVLRALAPLRRALCELVRDPARASRLRMRVGGLVGLGAFLYSFVRIGRWLGEPALLREAHDLTLLFSRDRIAGDAHLDVVDGSAGAVLALLALDDAAPGANSAGATPLDLASACAAHLLDRRISHEGRPLSWAGPGKPPLTGFAHGAAGIGHALLRLFARTGDEALRAAALEGFAFERSLFDRKADNWLDPRSGRLLELSAWCHGSPGIALGRLGALGVHGADREVREELPALLQSTRSVADVPLDHLCCGNLGRADILLDGHQVLGDPALLEEALALGSRVVDRAEVAGGFALLLPGEAPGFRPSFFRGVSGIGYALLRLAGPDTLPCTLRME